MRTLKFIIHICLISGVQIHSFSQTRPLLENRRAVSSIEKTLDLVYNFEFDEAIQRIDNGVHNIGDHPANYILKALVIYWKDRPLAPETQPYIDFERYLTMAIEKSGPFLEKEFLYKEGIFYCMAGYGLLAELYSEEGVGLKVLNTAQKAYKYLKAGKEITDEFPDFYFSTGLYNYYREKYPELRPFYKSLIWIFASGDKSLGIEQLIKAKEQAVFTHVEATIYLFHIYQRYENNPEKALSHVIYLTQNYPGNIRFKSLYAEVLLGLNEFNKVEEVSEELIKQEIKFHKLAGVLFKAIVLEKNNELSKSEKTLDQAFAIHESMDKEYFHYLSMMYAVKARLADKKGDTEMAEDYYRKALKSNPYVPVNEEAQTYLNK